jgi:hypothetical protein
VVLDALDCGALMSFISCRKQACARLHREYALCAIGVLLSKTVTLNPASTESMFGYLAESPLKRMSQSQILMAEHETGCDATKGNKKFQNCVAAYKKAHPALSVITSPQRKCNKQRAGRGTNRGGP